MEKPKYAILRFQKYKGAEIGQIEAHNERTKEKYASNPDVDLKRTHLNFHLISPTAAYGLEYTNKIRIGGGKCARGFTGIEILQFPTL